MIEIIVECILTFTIVFIPSYMLQRRYNRRLDKTLKEREMTIRRISNHRMLEAALMDADLTNEKFKEIYVFRD